MSLLFLCVIVKLRYYSKIQNNSCLLFVARLVTLTYANRHAVEDLVFPNICHRLACDKVIVANKER